MKRALTSLLCLFAALVMSAQETENLKKVNIDSLFNEALTSYDENRLEDAKDQLHQVVKVCVREKTRSDLDFESRVLLSHLEAQKGELDHALKWLLSINKRAVHHPECPYPDGWRNRLRQEMVQLHKVIEKEENAKLTKIHRLTQFMVFLLVALCIIIYLYISKLRAYSHLERKAKEWAKKAEEGSEEERDLFASIKEYVESTQCYLNPEFKIGDLATAVGTNRSYVSKTINENADNYNSFVNEYRVKEAIRLMTASPREPLADICIASGFNNRKSFNTAFKQFTGLTPSEFRNSI